MRMGRRYGDSSANPPGCLVRNGRTNVVHGTAMLAGLLLSCSAASCLTDPAKGPVSAAMPDALLGVWHSNEPDGRTASRACKKKDW